MNNLLNWLSKPAGAVLAPLFLALVAGISAWIADKFPAMSTYFPPDLIALVLLSVALAVLNYVTTARSFKYSLPVQQVIGIIGKQFGLEIKQDGVIGPASADTSEKLANVLTVKTSVPEKVLQAKTSARMKNNAALAAANPKLL